MTNLANLKHFPFDGSDVRVTADADHPMFVANDVARALGYKDVRHAVQAHCKYGYVAEVNIPDHLGRPQYPVIIPESDMYRLVFRSRLPSAERFADWVFEEVLPSIRATGGYSLDDMTIHGENVRERTLLEQGKYHRQSQALYSELQAYKRRFGELDVDD